jgi:hypothetical protein
MRRRASHSTAWSVAQKLRARRGWLLDEAFCQRSWTVQLGATAFETTAHVSFFFDAPGMVITLTPSFPKAPRAATCADALELLRSCLGERYRISPLGDSVFTKLRSDKTKQLLAEIVHVERVFGERIARRFGPIPRSRDQRRWYVVEALRASSWLLGTLSFSRKIGDEQRGLGANVSVIVDSARAGLSVHFGGWVPKTSERWTQFCDATAARLTTDGFRIDEQTPSFVHAGRWIAGLRGARALQQADVLDELIDRGDLPIERGRTSRATGRARQAGDV